jgi:hypothetical protein
MAAVAYNLKKLLNYKIPQSVCNGKVNQTKAGIMASNPCFLIERSY